MPHNQTIDINLVHSNDPSIANFCMFRPNKVAKTHHQSNICSMPVKFKVAPNHDAWNTTCFPLGMFSFQGQAEKLQ